MLTSIVWKYATGKISQYPMPLNLLCTCMSFTRRKTITSINQVLFLHLNYKKQCMPVSLITLVERYLWKTLLLTFGSHTMREVDCPHFTNYVFQQIITQCSYMTGHINGNFEFAIYDIRRTLNHLSLNNRMQQRSWKSESNEGLIKS